MSTIKTPEQIADEYADELNPKTHAEWERIRGVIQSAIYTDRAQRYKAERDAIQAVLGHYLNEKEN